MSYTTIIDCAGVYAKPGSTVIVPAFPNVNDEDDVV